MAHLYSLTEAQSLLPEAAERLEAASSTLIELRREVRASEELGRPDPGERAHDLERQLEAHLRWFDERDIQVKGISPGLLDFPARAIRAGEPIDILLCWRDDEDAIGYYHRPETGYIGREPVAMLDEV